jgi:hypothetical protein
MKTTGERSICSLPDRWPQVPSEADHDFPDDLSYLLEELGHDVTLLRKALPRDSSDEAVFQFAHDRQP